MQLVEQVVPNYVENYAGKVDFVARYQGVPHVIVVALPDQKAEVFQFDRTKLVYHWNQWLNRLQNFQCVAAA